MKKPGFTLLELIVSVGIITMVTGLFLANYSSANRRTDLTMTAQKLVSDVRLAQSYALGLAKYGNDTSINIPAGGWGVHFDLQGLGSDRYVIFADNDGDHAYDSDESNESYGAVISHLPKNISINSISMGTKMDVIFMPPDPVTYIKNDISSSTSATVVLRDNKTNALKTVRMNFLGLVELID